MPSRGLKTNDEIFDFVVIDFPDPLHQLLVGQAIHHSVLQAAGTPFEPRWAGRGPEHFPALCPTIFSGVAMMKAAGFKTNPIVAYVPSFGEWGFRPSRAKARLHAVPALRRPPVTSHRWQLPQLFQFPADMVCPGRSEQVKSHQLVRLYEREWRELAR